MFSRIILFSTILIVTLFIDKVFTLKCFQCNSYEDPYCGEIKKNETNSKYYKECEQERNATALFCRKTYQRIYNQEEVRITRSCGWIVYKNNKDNCRASNTDFRIEESCQCFTDGCNGAYNKALSVLLTPILFLHYSIY